MAQFYEVYKEYSGTVYKFLLSLSGDQDLASELLQETFYRALMNIDRFEGRSSLVTWLCQIGKNAYFKEYKRKKRITDLPTEQTLNEDSSSPEELVIRKDECKRIRAILSRLEEPYQGVFSLRVFGEQSYKDIGGVYGKTENWARVTYYRAKEKIIKEVEK
ncbi:MAG: sigma-70 family RNA polymerase sigma factor [Clostridia bacterium]|nr:sigma-70 family RNA polymerase sigma factor [Clostridia bacterium]